MEQDAAIERNLPPDFARLFRSVPTDPTQLVASANRGLDIAFSTNTVQERDLNALLENCTGFERRLEQLSQAFYVILNEVKSMLRSISAQQEVVRATRNALTATESSLSASIIDNVPDQEDVDHME